MAKPDLMTRLSTQNPDSDALVVQDKKRTSSSATPSGDALRASRVGLLALGVGLGGFLLWAAFAPLDEGVPSQGLIAIDTKRKAVQHPVGGIVTQVLVGEGSQVKEGQLLMKLDEAATRAGYEAVRQHYLSFRASQGRLIAEQTGAPSITFHPDLQAASTDPLIQSQIVTQQQLFQSRKAGLRAELQSMQETIQGQEALIASYKGVLESRRESLKLVNEELTQTRELVKEGYTPRNRQLELERMVSESGGAIAELLGNITRAQRSISELRQKIIARQQDYRKEVETLLTDVTQQVQSDEPKLRALSEELARVEIKAPAAGQVVGLAVQTVGGVVQAGQKIMDIVPENETLLIETRVAPNLIDKVIAGLPVDIRFSSFANAPSLVVDGKVVSISGDLLTDPQTGIQYYLSRVAVTPDGYKMLGKHQLQPGMPVEVILKTGERSLLAYMLHPLTKRLAASMKEQ